MKGNIKMVDLSDNGYRSAKSRWRCGSVLWILDWESTRRMFESQGGSTESSKLLMTWSVRERVKHLAIKDVVLEDTAG